MQKFKIKRFNELSLDELYSILFLRSEVFVVEQNCAYLDIDKKDSKAIHVLGYINDDLASYCRMFNAGDYFEDSSIGRVVVSPKYRSLKLGHELMKVAIDSLKTTYNQKSITISAQEYLVKFYETHGFVQTSESYLEDDIPHIEMKRKIEDE
ncbi:GNAT family N-acetyltransferase [Flavobacterium oreochromis]|uniref:GNAT family N-acetyltransferase n=2 Tax=Flavobacterium TaxID=237 RepID=A0A246GGC2_9FLAO|nr:GNAT family N-acetyltransferase [Flavobacterium oreochromis]OWP79121.1 GNAT family N-acetyltransferase [Flavobacterium oreochromis]OWP79826.1 GNAT family N-acetyltransferase [Flavobacterium oreochromis]POR30712.1 GNAT family N-acetyltransferase [Flavobacterium columnare]QYS87301.1 GNAT family N-acetyltransferase [Flavobacterium oreochromis]